MRGTTASITVCSDGFVARIDLRKQNFLSYTTCFLNVTHNTFANNINTNQDWKMLLNLENRTSHCQNLPTFTSTFHFHFATRFFLCCTAQHNAAQRQQLQKHRAGTATLYVYLIQVCPAYLVHLQQIVLNTWAERHNVYTMHFQYSLSNLNKNLFHLLPYLPLSF